MKFKVGDKVINNKGETGTVICVLDSPRDEYPVQVDFGEDELHHRWYSHEGKRILEKHRTWEHEIRLVEEELEREYKVGDKIRIPHAEELLLKGFKLDTTGMTLKFDATRSVVALTWCGKDVEVLAVDISQIQLKGDASIWWVVPEHLGLLKIKQPRPEPKIGEWWRLRSGGVCKIIADRSESPRYTGSLPIVVLREPGETVDVFSKDSFSEKVSGWEE